MAAKEIDRLTLMVTVRVPVGGVAAFQAYEDAVLPLLPSFGGRLERRLRNADGTLEIHIVSFPSDADFQRYRNDPRRIDHSHLLEKSAAKMELMTMIDVS